MFDVISILSIAHQMIKASQGHLPGPHHEYFLEIPLSRVVSSHPDGFLKPFIDCLSF
jgi:hypothetical protein